MRPKEIDLQRFAFFSYKKIDLKNVPDQEVFVKYQLLDEHDSDPDAVAYLDDVPSGGKEKLKRRETRTEIPSGTTGVLIRRRILKPNHARLVGNFNLLMDAYVVKITLPNGSVRYAELPAKYVNK